MPNKELWIDTRLNQEEMDFLWTAISEENKKDASGTLAGNISKSEYIEDKDNWFYKTVLKKLIEKMFYRNCDNYYEKYIEKEEPLSEFELNSLWVNYMKQYEFNPLHNHFGLYSFVVFMKIPTHWKEQHALPISANSNIPCASDFEFVWSEKGTESLYKHSFCLSSEDEGRMLFFPAWLKHQVLPFYECKEERVTISGNIRLYEPNRPKELEKSGSAVEEKEKMLEMIEESVIVMKKELKQMKKEGEKEGAN